MLANQETSYPIAVSPGLIDVGELKPGETYEGTFRVLNPSTDGQTVEYSVAPAPLTFETKTYDLSFSDPDDFNQIAEWITIVENAQGALVPQEKHEVKFRITVPEDAPAGGQYAGLLVSLENNPSGTTEGISVANKSRIAVLLYSKVAGETREEGYVLENNVPSLFLGQPIKTSSLIENTGNVHIPATYTLRIYPFFGGEEVYTNEDSPVTSTVIPDTILYQEKTWEDTPLLGLFRIEQDIDFGDRIDHKQTVALVAPLWFVILAFLFIASVMYGIIERISKHKEAKNQHKKP